MSNSSKIEWTDATWNPVTGCTKVSDGCINCYAVQMSRRLAAMGQEKYAGLVVPGAPTKDGFTPEWSGKVVCHDSALAEPFKWAKPQMVFVCSMSDLFHSEVPWEFIVKVFDVMAVTPWHTYQLLTKRPGRMVYFANHIWPQKGGYWRGHREYEPIWPTNVWAGTSVEKEWDGNRCLTARLDLLAQVPAPIRFASCEPLLGPLNLRPWLDMCVCGDSRANHFAEGDCVLTGISQCDCRHYQSVLDWVIAGGESGPHARPMHPDWARSLRNQCQAAGVPFFFKQWGEWAPRTNYNIDSLPRASSKWLGGWEFEMLQVGKKAAGALLDGLEYQEFPQRGC